MTKDEPTCFRCKKAASQIDECVQYAADEKMTPGKWAMDDGTYNPETNRFACTKCYIEIGMPSSRNGWIAP